MRAAWISCALLVGAAAYHAPQYRPVVRVGRAPPNRLVLRDGLRLGKAAPRDESRRAPAAGAEPAGSRRAVLDAVVFAGLAFYLGGLFGQMTNSQLVLALQSLRFETERRGAEEPRALEQPSTLEQPSELAGAPADDGGTRELPLRTIAVNSGIMYLLGVLCSPTVLPLLDRAKRKLDRTQPSSLWERWLWRRRPAPSWQRRGAALGAFNVTISPRQAPVGAKRVPPHALGEEDALRLAPDYIAAGMGDISTTITMPLRRVLALPAAGQSSGVLALLPSVRIVSRRHLRVSMPMLLPREVAMLCVLFSLMLIGSLSPSLAIHAVRVTVVRT